MAQHVTVVPYDPSWPARFRAEAAAVRAALGHIFFPVKGHGAVAAIAGLHGDFNFVNKHICAFLR